MASAPQMPCMVIPTPGLLVSKKNSVGHSPDVSLCPGKEGGRATELPTH